MKSRSLIGTRIRDYRMKQGLHQTELARMAGISASYLNLIEHNRRRIAGATLNRIADALGATPGYLAEGARDGLLSGLAEIAASQIGGDAEADRAEAFAGQFPGWAETALRLHRKTHELEQRVHDLSDRLASDPELADALHDVLSTVTSIRSTASILAGGDKIEPEWQYRFHRNIDEDSRRLAKSSEALVRYLDGHSAPEIRTPQDEAQAFFAARDFQMPDLEADRRDVEDVMAEAAHDLSPQAQGLVHRALNWLSEDARILPLATLARHIPKTGPDPYALARELGLGLPLIFRRLASLDESIAGPVGLVICDSSGALIFRKPIAGFSIPRGTAACTLWPLFQSLAAPQIPLRMRLSRAGRNDMTVLSICATQTTPPQSFDQPALSYGHMVLLPDRLSGPADPVRMVGADCRICPARGCAGRREPSILAQSF